MRILFVCGCLEPGRDGVGDYVRRMADACECLGCEVGLVALHDLYVAEMKSVREGQQFVMRMPVSASWARRLRYFVEAISTFKPDVTSLQYVPFAYDRWGFAPGLARLGAALPREMIRHILFHELWLQRRDGGRKAQLRGIIQKAMLPRFLTAWRPTLVHTTNELYQKRLERIGVKANKLELFSNIPICDVRNSNWFEDQIGFKSPEEPKHHWIFGVFGKIHPEWHGASAAERLVQLARAHNQSPLILWIGRGCGSGERWKQWQRRFGERVIRTPLGEQPMERISEFLQKIDFGLSTNPLALTGKSTSVAAMLEHGLPVIAFRLEGTYHPPAVYRVEQVIPADDTLGERISSARRLSPEDRLPVIARSFLGAIRQATA
jgi:hypothetical protein